VDEWLMFRMCSAILEVCALFFVGLKYSFILVLKVLSIWLISKAKSRLEVFNVKGD
jgi:hypothetical protein